LRTFVVVVLLGFSGCAFGLGPYNAASAALVNSDGVSYSVANDQSGVPDGWVRMFAESIGYMRIPVGLHYGIRKGFLRGGELTEQHYDFTLKVWKIAAGYSRLDSNSNFDRKKPVTYTHDGVGNALRLSFAPIPPVSFDMLYGSVNGELSADTHMRPLGVTKTPDLSLRRLDFGLTIVPWGKGIFNTAFRFDIATVSVDGHSSWGPSFEFLLTVL
jgi:hypothetical protein